MLQLCQLGRVIFQDSGHRFSPCITAKSAMSSQHFVQNCTQSKDVGPSVYRFSANLLWSHITGSAHHHAGSRLRTSHGSPIRICICAAVLLHHLCEPKIENLYASFLGKE